MQDEELIARLRAVDASWSQVGEDCAAAADRIEALAPRVAVLEAERVQILRREEEAWRRANHAEAKVRGWQSTLVVRDLPMMSVPVTGWGPGEGEQTAVPQITPERLTDILDRLTRAEAAEARAERLEAKVALASEELSLIAVMGYSDDPKVAANIARMAVERAANARAALTEAQKDRTDG